MAAKTRLTSGGVTRPPAKMRVASNTDPHDLAVALVAALHDGERVTMRAIGAGRWRSPSRQ